MTSQRSNRRRHEPRHPLRRDLRRAPSLAASLALLLAVAGCATAPEPLRNSVIRGQTMGTYYQVTLGGDVLADDAKAALQHDIDALLLEINKEMSTYDPDSQLSRFNRSDSTDWIPVPEDVVRVTRDAIEIANLSDGAFDVTAGPLINLWSFGPDRGPERIPGDDELSDARQRVGIELLETRDDPPSLRKQRADVYVDLSGIAKGDAVDRIGALLASQGHTSYLADIGGENLARGLKRDGSAWRIAIEIPDGERGIQRTIELRDRAVATSGDYRNYFEIDGRRFSHIVDPRTGRPGEHTLASVSVLGETSGEADAWATALMVLGAEEALAVAEREGLAALLIVRDGETFIERESTRFSELNAESER